MCWLPANAERQKEPFEAPGGRLDEVRAFEAYPVAFSQVLHVAAAHEELRGLESHPNLGPRLVDAMSKPVVPVLASAPPAPKWAQP